MCGQVKYLKMSDEMEGSKQCLVEFAEQNYIIEALKLNGQNYNGSILV